MGTIQVSVDDGPMQSFDFVENPTAERVNAAFAEAGIGSRIRCLTPEEAAAARRAAAAWHAPEAVRERKLAVVRAASEHDLAEALEYLQTVVGMPRARRRAASRHPLLAFMHGGLLPREIDAVYAYLTDYPDDY